MPNKYLFIVLLLAFLSHLTYLNAGFVWLDTNDIVEKQAVLPLKDIGKTFFIPFGQTHFYRPVVTILNSLDHAVYGLKAPGYHLTNLLLHLLIIIVLPRFLLLFFTLSVWQLFLASLIFAVHPASILILGEVIERQESLLLLFLMLTLLFHSKNSILAPLCFALALFSKETALVVLPLLIIFWEFTKSGPFKPRLKLYALEISAIIVYIMLRVSAVPDFWGTDFQKISLSQNIGSRIMLLDKFFLQMISPLKPNFSDSLRITELADLSVIFTVLIIFLIFLLILKLGLKSQTGKAVLLFAILLLPALNLIPVPRIASPHYLYLPLLGFIPMALIPLIYINNNFKKIYTNFIYLWIIVAFTSSFLSGFQFKNDLTLFTPEVQKDPNFLEGYFYLGMHHLKNNNPDEAENALTGALKKTPGYLVFENRNAVLVNLSAIKFQKGNLDESESLLKEALASNPEGLRPTILYNLALIAYQKKDSQTIIDLLSGIEFSRKEPYLILAESYHAVNRIDMEISTLKKALPYSNPAEKNNIEELIRSYKSN